MIIWGSKGKTNDVGRGQFYCPKCQMQRQYVHKEVGKYFTLYFIPLFRTSMLGEYIECQTCLTPFEKTVLEYDHAAAESIQKITESIRDDIESGIPVQVIYKSLLNEGASEDAANTVLSIATKGQMKVCKSCESVFAGSLNYCSICGKPLEPTS